MQHYNVLLCTLLGCSVLAKDTPDLTVQSFRNERAPRTKAVGDGIGFGSNVEGASSSLFGPETTIDKNDGNQTSSSLSESSGASLPPVEKSADDTLLEQCGLWLAPSTIPNAGLGLFAGRSYKVSEPIQSGALGDTTIPIIDIRLHTGDPSFIFLWDEYTWSGENLHMDQEGISDINVASPGFGAAANCFLPLQNVDEWNPKFNNLNFHRLLDPGAGAFSYYSNRTTTATRDLQAGEELFVSYGEQWFIGREFLGPIPLEKDLDNAQNLLKEYREFFDRNLQQHHVSKSTLAEVWSVFVQHTAFNNSRVLMSFNHSDSLEFEDLLLDEKNLTEIRIEQASRSPEWLHQHGTCADNLKPGPSTLEQAGLGAFASRFLPEGSIVSHLPLIHIFDRTIFEMYNLVDDEMGQRVPDPSLGVASFQLLLNYCMGHSQSSLLLCPYAPMASYVNHNQTRANVRLQWSDPTRSNHMPTLLEKDLSEVAKSKTAKLAMDFVALRDIVPDEEIFLDYGDEWEEAWQYHLETWEPVEYAGDYVSAYELNEDKEEPLRTEFDEIEFPLPNVELWCNNIFLNRKWRSYYDEGKLDEFVKSTRSKIYRCDIMRYKHDDILQDGNLLYTAIMWHEDKEKGLKLEKIGKLIDVPRDAFTYYDVPYTSDIHLPNAFRHDIRIPDEIFPDVWKNWPLNENDEGEEIEDQQHQADGEEQHTEL